MLNNNSDFGDLVNYLIDILSLLVPVIFGLIIIVLVWRLIDAWIINGGGSGDKVDEGKKTALTAVIVLVVLSGIWGILALLQGSLFNF